MRSLSLVGLLSLSMFTNNAFAKDSISVGSTVDFSSGHYSAQTKTEMTAIVTQARYRSDNFTLQFDVPYVYVSGAGRTVSAVDPMVVASAKAKSRTTEGIGDITLGAIYNAFYDAQSVFAVDVAFKLKLPTASHREGLGTGQPDETVQLSAYKSFDSLTLLLTAGYKWVGEPVDRHYRNIASASTGLIYQLSNAASAGVLFDVRQSVFARLDDQREVTVYGAYKFSPAWKTQLYLYKGITNTSPDFGLGTSLFYQF